MVVGPLLARFGKGFVPRPGGDKIGRRRFTTHFLGFQRLGAKFDFSIAENYYAVEASNLKGCYMLLDEASSYSSNRQYLDGGSDGKRNHHYIQRSFLRATFAAAL